MSFREIDDAFWESIEPYLSPHKPHAGRPCADMSKLMNGICTLLWQVVREKMFPVARDLSQQFIGSISIFVNIVHISENFQWALKQRLRLEENRSISLLYWYKVYSS